MDTVILLAMTYGGDMSSNKTSNEEACSGLTKHGDIVVKYHEERQASGGNTKM